MGTQTGGTGGQAGETPRERVEKALGDAKRQGAPTVVNSSGTATQGGSSDQDMDQGSDVKPGQPDRP